MYNFFIWSYFHLLLVYFFIANFLSLFLVYHKGSFSCLLFFLIYIDILSNVRASTIKQFAYHFFFLVHDAKPLAFELNSDLQNKTGLEYWLEISVNPDIEKQAQKVIFSRNMKMFCKKCPNECKEYMPLENYMQTIYYILSLQYKSFEDFILTTVM